MSLVFLEVAYPHRDRTLHLPTQRHDLIRGRRDRAVFAFTGGGRRRWGRSGRRRSALMTSRASPGDGNLSPLLGCGRGFRCDLFAGRCGPFHKVLRLAEQLLTKNTIMPVFTQVRAPPTGQLVIHLFLGLAQVSTRFLVLA